eukprot:TRINITY_DN6314_c0_g1_i1.p1 TRINITY_DN6314_c0_g1~~TRINITY_DN6314_c0_g1_i1.p1  ORF type:complete len:523 (-),score=107.07 TRINITY_DN6314_c0_g1_i1:382-1950(-)
MSHVLNIAKEVEPPTTKVSTPPPLLGVQRATLRWLLLLSFVTAGLCALQIVLGLLANSLALLADSVHSSVDVISYGLNYFVERAKYRTVKNAAAREEESGIKVAQVDALGALLSTVVLLAATGVTVVEAVERLKRETDEELDDYSSVGGAMLLFAFTGTVANVGTVYIFRYWRDKAALEPNTASTPSSEGTAPSKVTKIGQSAAEGDVPPPPAVAIKGSGDYIIPPPAALDAPPPSLLPSVHLLREPPVAFKSASSTASTPAPVCAAPPPAYSAEMPSAAPSPPLAIVTPPAALDLPEGAAVPAVPEYARPARDRRANRAAKGAVKVSFCADFTDAAAAICSDPGCTDEGCGDPKRPAAAGMPGSQKRRTWMDTLHMFVHPGCSTTGCACEEDKQRESKAMSLNVAAAMIHLFADVLRSVTILVVGLLIEAGVIVDAGRADAYCALAVAAFIFLGSVALFPRMCPLVWHGYQDLWRVLRWQRLCDDTLNDHHERPAATDLADVDASSRPPPTAVRLGKETEA